MQNERQENHTFFYFADLSFIICLSKKDSRKKILRVHEKIKMQIKGMIQ